MLRQIRSRSDFEQENNTNTNTNSTEKRQKSFGETLTDTCLKITNAALNDNLGKKALDYKITPSRDGYMTRDRQRQLLQQADSYIEQQCAKKKVKILTIACDNLARDEDSGRDSESLKNRTFMAGLIDSYAMHGLEDTMYMKKQLQRPFSGCDILYIVVSEGLACNFYGFAQIYLGHTMHNHVAEKLLKYKVCADSDSDSDSDSETEDAGEDQEQEDQEDEDTNDDEPCMPQEDYNTFINRRYPNNKSGIHLSWIETIQRGTGLGTLLLAKIATDAIRYGYHGLDLESAFGAEEFYDRIGLESIRLKGDNMPIFYTNNLDTFLESIMAK